MGGGSRKSYATLYIGGVAHCIYLTEGGWSFWPLNIEILRNMFMVPCYSYLIESVNLVQIRRCYAAYHALHQTLHTWYLSATYGQMSKVPARQMPFRLLRGQVVFSERAGSNTALPLILLAPDHCSHQKRELAVFFFLQLNFLQIGIKLSDVTVPMSNVIVIQIFSPC